MRIALGELKPDQPDLANDGLEDAVNCIPYEVSYGPFPSSTVFSSSLSATAIGAVSVRDTSGNVYTFAGTNTTLYRASATGWDDVSRTVSPTYAAATDAQWRFALFGNTLLALNGTDPMQVFTLGTSTDFRNQSASASAPIATYIATVRDFVMVGNIATLENRVAWSYINNPLRWGFSVLNQSDTQDLAGSGGEVQGLTGGDFACILTRGSVWRGDYVGAPLFFEFNEVAPNVGCYIPGSVARYQNLTFFYSELGFQAFNGIQAEPIGSGKIDEFFAADLNISFLHRVYAVVDPVNKLYIVAYPSTGSSNGIADRMLLFKWTAGRWTRVEETVELIFMSLSAGFTLEGLDAISGSLDALAFSLDSEVWQGGALSFSGFNSGHRWINFDGSAKTARFTTGEDQLIEDHFAFVTAIRPLVQGNGTTAVTTTLGARDRLIDSVSFAAAVAVNSTGICPQRSSGRYHRLQMDVSGSFTRAVGFDVELVRDGMR